MHCLNLRVHNTGHESWSVSSCAAHDCLYVPSVGELEEFCRSPRHQRCHMLKRKVAASSSMAVEKGGCSFQPLMPAGR